MKEDKASGKEISISLLTYAQECAAGPAMECWKGPLRSMGGCMEDLLVLYWEARGVQKLSSLIPLPRLHPAAPCHMWWGSYHCLQDFTGALRRGDCSVTDSERYLLHQRVLPISPDCINASTTTTPKEILVTQIPVIPPLLRAQHTHSGNERAAGMEPQSCPSLSSQLIPPQVIISSVLYFMNLSRKRKIFVQFPTAPQFERELLPFGSVSYGGEGTKHPLRVWWGTHSLKLDSETNKGQAIMGFVATTLHLSLFLCFAESSWYTRKIRVSVHQSDFEQQYSVKNPHEASSLINITG